MLCAYLYVQYIIIRHRCNTLSQLEKLVYMTLDDGALWQFYTLEDGNCALCGEDFLLPKSVTAELNEHKRRFRKTWGCVSGALRSFL